MLKPIAQPFCCGALNACLELQLHLLRWLCDSTITAADVIQSNLIPPLVPTQIEADWLWRFLCGRKQTRLGHAKVIAGMSIAEKYALLSWSNAVVALAAQFQPMPTVWPATLPAIPAPAWSAFKDLMEAFYESGLKSKYGLPYRPDGTPVEVGGVNYADFVQAFRETHRQNPDPNAHELCVLCGGLLGQTPEVDHWIAKSAFPLLSVCADNLLPICGECNSSANKGEKDVHSAGSFDDWFHPYFRPTNGALELHYALPELIVECLAARPIDQPKVDNLNRLLNLSDRWTKKFKAEYLIQQDEFRRTLNWHKEKGQPQWNGESFKIHIERMKETMSPMCEHYEIRQLLFAGILEKARFGSWQVELGLEP
jgi:hypothetical protein